MGLEIFFFLHVFFFMVSTYIEHTLFSRSCLAMVVILREKKNPQPHIIFLLF